MDFIDFNKRKPSNREIIAFFRMVFSDTQQAMEFEYTDNFNKMSDQEILSFYNDRLVNKINLGYWCSIGDRTVGMIGVNRFSNSYEAHIAGIGFGVDIEYRKQGICIKLMELAEKRAVENNITRLECSCLHINEPAITLLKKLNYIEEGRKIRSVLKDGIYYDRVLFGKLLK